MIIVFNRSQELRVGKTFNPLRPQEKIDLVMKKKRNKLVLLTLKGINVS